MGGGEEEGEGPSSSARKDIDNDTLPTKFYSGESGGGTLAKTLSLAAFDVVVSEQDNRGNAALATDGVKGTTAVARKAGVGAEKAPSMLLHLQG